MRFLFFVFLSLICGSAFAQGIYRCGNQFQEWPCDTAATPARSNSTPESQESRTLRESAPEEKRRAHQQYECTRYDRELQDVYAAQGRGDNYMDTLNRRARDIEARRAAAGCS